MNRLLIPLILAPYLVSCDPDRHKKCEWYLVPEPDHRELVEDGWVSLCARNYTTNKQRCFLQAKFDFAKEMYGKPITFDSLKMDKSYPRKISAAKVCTPEGSLPQ
ncbi:MAG: hypothetical protein HRU19_13475 [Pseudobacteriovorax sp.]|nr:hypothetical protein [Pseudobacteriovorax sp.]